MKLRSTAAAVLAAILFAPTASANPAPTKTDLPWRYIVDGKNGALFFGRNIRHYEGVTFIDVKTEADPDGGNGDEEAWVQPLNCDKKLWMNSKDEWEPISEGSIVEVTYQMACASRTNLSERKGVAA